MDGKKIFHILLLQLLLIFSSCFFKLDKIDNTGNVEISLKNISMNPYEEGEYETIEVVLTNRENGRTYRAIANRTQGKQEMIFEKIPFGIYAVEIRLKNEGENIPYSIIKEDLIVGSGTAKTVSGFIGAPNKVDVNSMIGSIRILDEECSNPYCDEEDCFMYEIFLKFEPVSSNYTSIESYDNIEYHFLIGTDINNMYTPEDFDSISHLYTRNIKNPLKDFISDNPGNSEYINNKIPACHIEGFQLESGRVYYWKVRAQNEKGYIDSLPRLLIVDRIENNLDTIEKILLSILLEEGFTYEAGYWSKEENNEDEGKTIEEKIKLERKNSSTLSLYLYFKDEFEDNTKEIMESNGTISILNNKIIYNASLQFDFYEDDEKKYTNSGTINKEFEHISDFINWLAGDEEENYKPIDGSQFSQGKTISFEIETFRELHINDKAYNYRIVYWHEGSYGDLFLEDENWEGISSYGKLYKTVSTSTFDYIGNIQWKVEAWSVEEERKVRSSDIMNFEIIGPALP